jgi:hypothetical protein
VPNHWTKINDEADAKPGDELYVDEQSGAIYVRGTAPGNTTKEAVAADCGVEPSNVIYPLKKKR